MRLLFSTAFVALASADDWLEHGRRPLPINRKFNSTAINNIIEEYKPRFRNPNISHLFENCLPNTLDTTAEHDPDKLDSFVITGDIHAMWLRDSTNRKYVKHLGLKMSYSYKKRFCRSASLPALL
jgi:hypothetical protein